MSTTPSARRPRSSRNAKKGTTAGAPADTQTPLAKSSAIAADKAAEQVKDAVAKGALTPKNEKGDYDAGTVRSPADRPVNRAAKATAEAEPVDVPALFRKGRTIAAIARDQKMGHDAIRKALDAAGVDYSADKNAKAPGARPAATPKAKGEWSLFNSFEAIRDKKVDPKSKRGRIVADLATEQNAYALRTIAADIVGAKDDPARVAALANALNAALSAHYARVS